ncbi:DUF6207 family protein [Streptomyces sp. TRM68367]|uniref:DUF6207 family protein n=1 Tax=Streptomyces sp. TRM68367 TaxID=2758415 RepID=UPI0037DD501D
MGRDIPHGTGVESVIHTVSCQKSVSLASTRIKRLTCRVSRRGERRLPAHRLGDQFQDPHHRWATATAERPTRDAGQPGVRLRCYLDTSQGPDASCRAGQPFGDLRGHDATARRGPFHRRTWRGTDPSPPNISKGQSHTGLHWSSAPIDQQARARAHGRAGGTGAVRWGAGSGRGAAGCPVGDEGRGKAMVVLRGGGLSAVGNRSSGAVPCPVTCLRRSRRAGPVPPP